MTVQGIVKGLLWLALLYVLVRALRGLGKSHIRKEKDSADLWLHSDAHPPKPQHDAPVVDKDDGDSDGDGD